tara:strand:+ start:447 stop:848 length:402 start_codon:yes stop_codon:yes gene_type:complete
MRLKFIILFILFISNNLVSQNYPKKIILNYYSDLPFQYVSSNDELKQLEIGLFVREISIELLNKFLEDFSTNIQEKNGYLIVINLINSKQAIIEIPFAINQNKLKKLKDSKESFEKICNVILNESYEWIIRYI